MNVVARVEYVPDAIGDRWSEENLTVDGVGVDGLLSELDDFGVVDDLHTVLPALAEAIKQRKG